MPNTTPDFTREQEYNARDCLVTYQALQALLPQLDSLTSATYSLSRSLQAPALEMMLRGINIDLPLIHHTRDTILGELHDLKESFSYLYSTLTGRHCGEKTYNSPKQIQEFLVNCLNTEPVFQTYKGERRESVDREALEKISTRDPDLSPIISLILAIRDRVKDLSTLAMGKETRIYTSFLPAGTVTGRWASRQAVFTGGGNLQNITEHLRKIFIPDPGMKFLNIDLEQADSRNVGLEVFLTTGDRSYFDACVSDDLHTFVAKLVWPDLPWTNSPSDRDIAETLFYRHYSHRFMCKKLGHGSNYLGKPKTLARQAKIPVDLAEQFQARYFSAFPGIPKWHRLRIGELQTKGYLISLLNRKRFFHGRLTDDATFREAIAFLGQSPTADVINLALLSLHSSPLPIQLLAQVHDSILLQYPETADENALIPEILSLVSVPISVTHNSTTLTHSIPCSAKTGWNWGEFSDTNPNGLIKWKPNGEPRSRVAPKSKAELLDTKLSRVY